MTKIATQDEFVSAGAGPIQDLTQGAGDIGQRIAGTSPSAVYYLVAKTEGLGVAMRWKGAQLSVRIAGPKLAEYKERLEASGIFTAHDSYFSAHMGQQGLVDTLSSKVSAQMLYASVLAAIIADGDVAAWDVRAPYQWRAWTTAT